MTTLIDDKIKNSESLWMKNRCNKELWLPFLQKVITLTEKPAPFFDTSLTFYDTGSAVVAALDEEFLVKVFPPDNKVGFLKEKAALSITHGKLNIPVPQIQDSGTTEECPWLLMTRLQGVQLSKVWNKLTTKNKAIIVEEIGRITASLHEIPIDNPENSVLYEDWSRYISAQLHSAQSRQISRNLPDNWVKLIPDFLSRHQDGLLAEGNMALLHTEIMHDHFLVDKSDGLYHISGLFDFADSQIGDFRYELPAVGLFISCGDNALFRTFCEAYLEAGNSDRAPAFDCCSDFSQELLAWTLCHRYAHLPWYMELMPPPQDCTNLEQLAEQWFGF